MLRSLPLRLLAAAALAGTAGCTAALTPAATVYPTDADMDFSQLAGMKQGEACSLTVLGVFGPNGDATVAAAARAGNLTRVRYVDNRFENYFLWQRFCVVAYGE